jgi:hypothetical protein
MKYNRLTNIAIRSHKYSVADIAVPTSLLLFSVFGLALFWTM